MSGSDSATHICSRLSRPKPWHDSSWLQSLWKIVLDLSGPIGLNGWRRTAWIGHTTILWDNEKQSCTCWLTDWAPKFLIYIMTCAWGRNGQNGGWAQHPKSWEALPANNTAGLNEQMLSNVHRLAPFLIVAIDQILAHPLSTSYAARTGIEADRLLLDRWILCLFPKKKTDLWRFMKK